MTDSAPGQLTPFCHRFGVSSPLDIERIRAGRNSEVLHLRNAHGQWILKHYYQHAQDKRDRLGTEFAFLTFLARSGVSETPRPLGADSELRYGLYSFVPGTRPVDIDASHIDQAAEFVRKINRQRKSIEARRLPKAADACTSWQDHLDLTGLRIGQLLTAAPTADLEVEAQAFVRDHLLASFTGQKAEILREVNTTELARVLPLEEQILSPSDFGFHNVLEHSGRLSFVDFEYAGWDDPAKLICDFICQPELPVSAAQGRQFKEALLGDAPDPYALGRRVMHLLPVHRIKWCCIMLNEFKLADRKRRSHAGLDSDRLLASQLGKAKHYFDAHLASTH